MARGTPHSDEIKAQVMAALMAGQSVAAVARQYRISRTTVSVWRGANGLDGSSPVNHQKKAELGDLIGNYLNQSLRTLSVQAEHFRDKAWLEKQPAAELAVLHGVLTDKAIRLLEALAPEDAAESE